MSFNGVERSRRKTQIPVNGTETDNYTPMASRLVGRKTQIPVNGTETSPIRGNFYCCGESQNPNPGQKDCKTGGYNIEQTKVSEARFLALVLLIAIAYSLTTLRGQQLNILPRRTYICRLQESPRSTARHSDFWIGTYGAFWAESMDNLSELAEALLSFKPQKRLYFLKGLTALRSIQQAV